MEYEQIIIEPIITEKSVREREKSGYVFKVHLAATKVAVGQAVEKLFKVKVAAVNVMYVRSKRRVVGKSIGRTSHWKKAYVRLAGGQKIQELET